MLNSAAAASLIVALAGTASAAAVLPQGGTVAASSSGVGATFNYRLPNTLTVNQSASRVVIDWQSFNIGAGQTVNFNQASPSWIAFNIVNPGASGLSPRSLIAGSLNAPGGVWVFSTGGFIFSSTAVVNVGSFAAVTGPLGAGGDAQLLAIDPAGFTTVTLGSPAAAGQEALTIQSGAQINAASGYVLLQSETMTDDGAVTAADGVEFLAAESGQIQFSTAGAGQQLQGANALLVAGQDKPALNLGGVTRGAWVGIDTPGGGLAAGYHELINLDGQIQATGVKPGTTDGVVFIVGDDEGPGFDGYTGSSIGIDAAKATIRATNGVAITSDSAALGKITAGGGLQVSTYGDIDIGRATSAGGAVILASSAGTIDLGAGLVTRGSLVASGAAITIGEDVKVQSDALGDGAGGLVLISNGAIAADPTSTILAGKTFADPDDSVSIRAGVGPGGGDIALGDVSATQVFIQSHSAGSAAEGAITLAGDVFGSQGVTVLIGDVTTAGAPAGALTALGDVQSPGFVDLENLGAGASVIGSGASVSSTGGQVFLYSGGDTTVGAGATVSGASILDHTQGTLTIDKGALVATSGASPAPIAPVIPFGSDFQRASGLNLAASNMIINGQVRAGTTAAPGDIYLEALGPVGGEAVIGGAGGGPGFDLSNASFGNLKGRNIIVMAGPGEAEGGGANLNIENLTLNPGKLSTLWLGGASTSTITISGDVMGTGGGAPVAVQIGFTRLGQGGTYAGGAVSNPGAGGLDGFVPGSIDIVGSLGTQGASLGAVNLIARGDILVGDAAFVAAAAADPSFNAAIQSGEFPGFTPGEVFVAAQSLQLASQGRIIEQNTLPNPLFFAGLDIGAPTAAQPLVYAPVALQGQTIGGVWTADFGGGPSAVVLFGSLASVNSPGASLDPNLLSPGIASNVAYTINGCAFGDACSSPASLVVFTPPELIEIAATGQVGDGGWVSDVSGSAANSTGVLSADETPNPIAPDGQTVGGEIVSAPSMQTDLLSALGGTTALLRPDDDRLGLSNPTTETGNGDLWSGAAADCPAGGSEDCTKP